MDGPMTTLAAPTTPTAHIEPAAPVRPRIRILDGIRLIAALLVVSWHYAAFGHGAHLTPYARVPAVYPVAAYGWLGVELFFLISGFVICMSSIGHTLGQFVRSRITRLYPAYWLAIVLTTSVLLFWPGESPLPWSDVAANLSMFQSGFGLPSVDAVYWTLWIELHFYVLFALVVWRGVTYRKVAAFCGVWLVLAYVGQHVGGHMDTMLIADYAPFFIAGIAFFLMHRFGQNLLLWAYVVVSYLLGEAVVIRTLEGSNTHLHTQIPVWPALVAVAAFYVVMAGIALGWLRAEWKWLTVAGAMTYPLYLVHEYIGWAILKSLKDTVPGPLLYVGLITMMLGLAWLINRFFERPVASRLKALLTWRRRTRSAPPATSAVATPDEVPAPVMPRTAPHPRAAPRAATPRLATPRPTAPRTTPTMPRTGRPTTRVVSTAARPLRPALLTSDE
jgi:peptidoglycan/LPS O-acetylase OafA/YrhL